MKARALFISVFVIATCGLIYELVAGALASYLLGDSVTQFSLVIGTYLSAMGAGSYLSKFVVERPLQRFVIIELTIGLIGGTSSAVLFFTFSALPVFKPILFGILAAIGLMVGLEIPLLLRILKDRLEFKDLVAEVLFLDYIGALAASLLFPFVFVPRFGLMQTAFAFGIANTLVALWATWIFADELPNRRGLRLAGTLITAGLGVGFFASDELLRSAERGFYEARPIYAMTTPYQRIVVTHDRGDIRLYLSGHLQFSSKDEHRYHEALVHPAFALSPGARRCLILGGGDGLALREVLKHPSIEAVQLVDLDPAMTELFRDEPLLSELNGRAMSDPRVTITNADALVWLDAHDERFDVIIIDLPDPSNFGLGKLYSRSFYALAKRHLAESGALVVQSTSPYYARKSFWCVAATLEAAGLHTQPYHAYVPSFGEWGYVLATPRPRKRPEHLPSDLPLRYLNAPTLEALFRFPEDIGPLPVEVNYLNTQALVSYYNEEWDP